MDTPLSVRRMSTNLASHTCSSTQNTFSDVGCENVSGHKRKHASEPSDEKKRVKECQVLVTMQQDNNLCIEKSISGESVSVKENVENDTCIVSNQNCLLEVNIQGATPSNQLTHLHLNSEDETAVKTNFQETELDSEMVTDHSKVAITDHNSKMDSLTSDHPADRGFMPDPGSVQSSKSDPDNIDRLLNQSKTDRTNFDKKASRRRSSFAHGRKSAVYPVISDVSFDISDDLPPDKRLAKLTAAVLQSSLSKVYRSLSDVEAIQQFTVEARAAGETCINCLEKTDTFKIATVSEGLVPNPANDIIQKRITSLMSYSNKLKEEFGRWNEILEEHRSEANTAEQKFKAVHENPVTERPSCGLTVREQKILERQTYYNEAMDQLQSYKYKALCAVQSIIATVKTFQQFQFLVDRKLREHAEAIYTKTFPEIKEIEAAPQQLIESVLEFKD